MTQLEKDKASLEKEIESNLKTLLEKGVTTLH
jgi:hypothetical protein